MRINTALLVACGERGFPGDAALFGFLNPRRRIQWLVPAHVVLGLLGAVVAYFAGRSPTLQGAAFVGLVFSQTSLLGIWSSLGPRPWWVRLIGVVVGVGYLVPLPPVRVASLPPRVMPPVAAAPAAEELILDESTVPSPKLETATQSVSTSTFVVTGVTLGITAGYVLLEVRNFYWLATLITSMPVLRQFDPLTILDHWEKTGKRRRRGRDEEDSLAPILN
jgi:hypothetical protein